MEVERGQIYYADLRPVVGSEQGGIRPVLIIQNNVGNRYSNTVIAATLTGNPKREELPTHVMIQGPSKLSMVQCEQLRTLDKRRLLNYVGRLEENTMKEIDKALRVSIGI